MTVPLTCYVGSNNYPALILFHFLIFQERVKAWQAWQSATAALTKKREAKVKAELQQKAERALILRQEIADHERQQVQTNKQIWSFCDQFFH